MGFQICASHQIRSNSLLVTKLNKFDKNLDQFQKKNSSCFMFGSMLKILVAGNGDVPWRKMMMFLLEGMDFYLVFQNSLQYLGHSRSRPKADQVERLLFN